MEMIISRTAINPYLNVSYNYCSPHSCNLQHIYTIYEVVVASSL
nr:MAG TPA: hypothetical protein [Caudoviricetes sp.]